MQTQRSAQAHDDGLREVRLVIAKIIGIVWMLIWFFIILRIFIENVANGSDLFGFLMGSITVWLLIAFLPIVIIKFGWSYIS